MTLTWHTPDRATIERDATYMVETNEGAFEKWSGALLYIRLRPEFVVGRAVRVVRISERVSA